MEGARSILLSITGGADLSLWEVNEAAKAVAEAAHPDANIIFGAMVDEKLDDQVWVTVVATGYGDAAARAPRAAHRGAGAASRASSAAAAAPARPSAPRAARATSSTCPSSCPTLSALALDAGVRWLSLRHGTASMASSRPGIR